MSSHVVNDAFRTLFPKYAELLSESSLPANESIETFLREELPRKVGLVRNMESSFNAFLTHFTNAIVKRPQHSHLIHSLILKASEKIDKYFHTLSLIVHKTTPNELRQKITGLDLQSIKRSFRQKLQSINHLLREKYFGSGYLQRQCEQEIAMRIYILLELYHFLKGDPVTIAGKFRLREQDVLWSVSKNQQPNDFSELIFLDSSFEANLEQTVQKRCRPFTSKRELLENKIRQVLREGESKVPPNLNLLIQSMISKQKVRITRQLSNSLGRELREIPQCDGEVEAKQMIQEVDVLKRQFAQLKNTTYFLDVMRGNFSEKYKMEVNRLQNVFYLTNLEKFLQDVSTFLEKILAIEEKLIKNRRQYMKDFGNSIQLKISDLIDSYGIQANSNLYDLISSQFDLLESALYGVVNKPAPKHDYQQDRSERQAERKKQMELKAQQQREKKEMEREKADERRKKDEQRLQQARIEREQKQRKRKEDNEKLQSQRRYQMEKKREQKLRKDEQLRKQRQQEIKKREETDKKKREEMSKKRQQQEDKKKREKDEELRRKDQQKRKILDRQQEQKRKRENDLKQRKRVEQQQKMRRQRERKQEEEKIKKQKQQKDIQQRKKQQQRTKLEKEKREKQQKEVQQRKKEEQRLKRQKQQRQKEQKEAEQRKKQQQRNKLDKERKQREQRQAEQKERRQRERKLKQSEERQKEQEKLRLQKEKKQKQQREKDKKAEQQRLARQNQRLEKQRKEKEDRQRRDREQKERRQKQLKEKTEKEKKQKEERQRKERQQKEKRQKQQNEKKQKFEKERKQRQQRERKEREQRQKREKQQRERRQKQQKQKREKLERQKRQREQKERKEKEERQKRQREQKERLQKEKKLKQQKQAEQLRKREEQQRNRKEQQLLKQQSKKPEPKKSSGINYGQFDDLVDDDLSDINANQNKGPGPSKARESNYLDDEYADDFDDESPEKQDEQIETIELIGPGDIKCLNQYMKGTTYSRKNKVNPQPLNKSSTYMLVFEELIQNKVVFFFEGPLSKAILDLGAEFANPESDEADLKMSIDTIKQQIIKQYQETIQAEQMVMTTKYIFPFSFQNPLNIRLIQTIPAHSYFRLIFNEEMPDNEEIHALYQGTIQSLLQIFLMEGEPQIEQMVINEESRLVLGTFQRELPCLLTAFALYYEQSSPKEILINQYTIERFFYSAHTIQPLYDVMKDQDQAIDKFFTELGQKYAKSDTTRAYSISVSSSQQNYNTTISHSAIAIKQQFKKSKNQTFLANFIVSMEDEEGEIYDRTCLYMSIEKATPKPVISYFLISKDPQDQQNLSTIFEMASEGDDGFEVKVYTDYTRHNGLNSYCDWSLPLWAHVSVKRKLSTLQAMRALVFAMTPIYLAYKQMD